MLSSLAPRPIPAMFDVAAAGKWIVSAGLGLVLIVGFIWLLGRSGLPIGNLPGDLRIQRDGFTCVFPLATSIVLSIILTLLLNLIVRLINR